MFSKRLFSSIVLVILAFAVILPGNYVLGIALLGISIVAFHELINAYEKNENKINGLLKITGLSGTILYYLFLIFEFDLIWLAFIVVMTFLSLMAVYVFLFPRYRVEEVLHTLFSFFYAPVLLSFLYLTRQMQYGEFIVWMIFISSWICDTCAYITGMLFGKHKLAPILSPKKSVEGAIGGIAGSALVGALFGFFIEPIMGFDGIAVIFAVIGACGAIISQIGDLAASAIKRNYELKDYGKLIPGHGGIMDRFDSVIFAAPIIYFLAVFFIQHASSL